MSVFADLKIKQPAHSLRSYFISFVSVFSFLTNFSLSWSSLINCYNSGPWRLEKHESRDENCLCKFRNSRLIFSKQFLTVTQEKMFKALIPVKFEICVWSDRVGETETWILSQNWLPLSVNAVSMETEMSWQVYQRRWRSSLLMFVYDTLHNYPRGCQLELTVSTCSLATAWAALALC